LEYIQEETKNFLFSGIWTYNKLNQVDVERTITQYIRFMKDELPKIDKQQTKLQLKEEIRKATTEVYQGHQPNVRKIQNQMTTLKNEDLNEEHKQFMKVLEVRKQQLNHELSEINANIKIIAQQLGEDLLRQYQAIMLNVPHDHE
jgi:hypothetical protein